MRRNLHTLLLHMYLSSEDYMYWAEHLISWDFDGVPALTILQNIYDDWTDGKIELKGVDLNEFQELWICDPDEIIGRRIKPIEGDV